MNKYGITVLVFIILMTGLFMTLPVNVAGYGQGHPDSCQPCHGDRGTMMDNTGNMWDHNIQDGTQAWNRCTSCHGDYVANTPHASVGCKCHAVVHVGYDNQGTWAAWLYAKEPSPTNLPAAIGDVASFQDVRLVFTNLNATPSIQAIVPSGGQEIEVGLYDAWTNEYLAVGAADAWKTCFNCHFLASDPTMVGAYKLDGGVWKVGIPEYTLKLDPHEITDVDSLEPPVKSGFNLASIQFLVTTLAAAFALYILLKRVF